MDTGLPSTADQYLCRDNYAVGFDYSTKNPKWVAYYVTSDQLGHIVKREDEFKEDTDIPEAYRATLDDYRNSGYDRGHNAPAGTVDTSEDTMEQCFLLSNMTPQMHTLNAEAWEQLEENIRSWTLENQQLYVVTGPLYDTKPGTNFIGNNVAIPDAYFKVVYIPGSGQTWGYVLPNQAVPGSELNNYKFTISELEQKTGMTFFDNKPQTLNTDSNRL